jgi:hypothetical protein
MQVTHIPEMGATSLLVVVSVAALAFALLNDMNHSSTVLSNRSRVDGSSQQHREQVPGGNMHP